MKFLKIYYTYLPHKFLHTKKKYEGEERRVELNPSLVT